MNEINWPISIKEIFYGNIVLTNGIKILKKRPIIFTMPPLNLKNIYNNSLKPPIDLNYETPDYDTVSISSDTHYKELKIGYTSSMLSLNPLLMYYFGLDEQKIEKEDYINFFTNLFNGKFAFENCELFGYQKKPNIIWKNGILIPNPEVESVSDYDIRKYDLVDDENKLARYFSLLIDVDYRNPEAVFTPLKEEGPIKKRILIGSEEQE